ncbi:uncharacterized protein LOC132709229 isoform X2 [Pantherophis guttatus]|uniref:Uncharacterized protein LOC132709229 isoform X2 n=1 Tax=Pantherophis guttatus TaxID=94885 RepID=A0ABM3YQ87_PANGU|nr:uncharacterized protein LOC132709229 isoform X2 [Pantherophis guttatus]
MTVGISSFQCSPFMSYWKVGLSPVVCNVHRSCKAEVAATVCVDSLVEQALLPRSGIKVSPTHPPQLSRLLLFWCTSHYPANFYGLDFKSKRGSSRAPAVAPIPPITGHVSQAADRLQLPKDPAKDGAFVEMPHHSCPI